jgi:hypothetical protein
MVVSLVRSCYTGKVLPNAIKPFDNVSYVGVVVLNIWFGDQLI